MTTIRFPAVTSHMGVVKAIMMEPATSSPKAAYPEHATAM